MPHARKPNWMKITAPKTWEITRETVNRKRKTLNTRVSTNRSKRDKTYPSNHSGYSKNCGSGGVANSIVRKTCGTGALSSDSEHSAFGQVARNLSHEVERRSDGLRSNKRQADVRWPLKRKRGVNRTRAAYLYPILFKEFA